MPIIRTNYNALVDDDGSNLVGSPIVKTTFKDVVLDPVDAAIAADIAAGVASEVTARNAAIAAASTVVSRTDIGAVNNWAPTLSKRTLIEWAGASDATFSGLAGGSAGYELTVRNTGTKVATFLHQSGLSSAGNKFTNDATSAGTPVAVGGSITFVYDGTNWVLVSHEQGTFIAYTPVWSGGSPVIGNGTISGKYVLSGRRVMFSLLLLPGSTTTFGGATAWVLTLPPFAADEANRYVFPAVSVVSVIRSGSAVADTTSTFTVVSASGPFNSTTPATWVNGSYLLITGSYFTS
jgi:hypothetical protein